MSENKDKDLFQKLFQKYKLTLFSKAIHKMGQKKQDELFVQLFENISSNVSKFSIDNLLEHIPELIQYSIALGIRLGVDINDYEEASRKIQEEFKKEKYDSLFI